MDNLSDVLRHWRWARKLTTRQAAKRIGITNSTLNRVEHGKPMDAVTLVRILWWLLGA